LAGDKALLRSWPAPKPQYAAAGRVRIGQDRRWRMLHALARLEQAKFRL